MTVNYASNIVPALCMVPIMAIIDKKITCYIPNVAKAAFKPFVLGILTFIVTVFVIGPLGAIVGNLLGNSVSGYQASVVSVWESYQHCIRFWLCLVSILF